MSNTRHDPTNSADSPTRNLSNSKLQGINIGLHIVCRIARILPEEERSAMIWLTNYAHLLDITADSLSEALDLDKAEIRRSLTDPDADRARFVRQVAMLRAEFEAGIETGENNPFPRGTTFHDAYGPLAETAVRRKIRSAVKFGKSGAFIIEIVAKTRFGKSVCAAREFLQMLDCAAWVHCPKPGPERAFYTGIAESLGIAVATNLKAGQLEPKIDACFGPNRLRFLFIDEGHRLWPNDLRGEPKRIEFLRDQWEKKGLTIFIFATPQYSQSQALAMEDNLRWAPGQWDGRVQRFHLPDTMEQADMSAVALHHLPEATPPMLAQLTDQANNSEGGCGAMVKAIQRARFMAEMSELPLNLEHIKSAQVELARGTRLEAVAKKIRPLPGRRTNRLAA